MFFHNINFYIFSPCGICYISPLLLMFWCFGHKAWEGGPSSSTRDWTCTPSPGKVKSQPLDCQGNPWSPPCYMVSWILTVERVSPFYRWGDGTNLRPGQGAPLEWRFSRIPAHSSSTPSSALSPQPSWQMRKCERRVESYLCMSTDYSSSCLHRIPSLSST